MRPNDEALRDSQRAIELFPRSGRAYIERAIAKEGLRETAASVLADFKRAAELDAKFTPAYEQALARLAPEGHAGQDAAPTEHGAPAAGRGVLEALARAGRDALSSDLGFAVFCAGLVGLVALGAFVVRRRG